VTSGSRFFAIFHEETLMTRNGAVVAADVDNGMWSSYAANTARQYRGAAFG
jgi:hypothetical protein